MTEEEVLLLKLKYTHKKYETALTCLSIYTRSRYFDTTDPRFCDLNDKAKKLEKERDALFDKVFPANKLG